MFTSSYKIEGEVIKLLDVGIGRTCQTVIPCEYPDKHYLFRNWNDCHTWYWKPHDYIFVRLYKTPECDGRTDRIPLAI